MPTHSFELRISVYGHPSAQPESVADLFGATHNTDADGSLSLIQTPVWMKKPYLIGQP